MVSPDAKGDRIYNGAMDNGTGLAHLIEQARAFATGPRPQRSVVFLAVTAEEKGLLGSEYYANNPLYPAAKTAGVINTDVMGVLGPARDYTIRGNQKFGLLDMLVMEGSKRGRNYVPDPRPETGGFFRSDHFTLAKVGVPAMSFGSGQDLVNGGVARAQAWQANYTAKMYHQPADEYDASWDFTGIAQDAELLHARRPASRQQLRMAELEPGQRIPRRPRSQRRRAPGSLRRCAAGQARRARMIAIER